MAIAWSLGAGYAAHLGSDWMQIIFTVSERYDGFAKYFDFRQLLNVWILQAL